MLELPIEDRFAIEELVKLYPLFCDTHQYEKVSELFADECIFDETSVGGHRVGSRAELLRLFQEISPRLGPFMHICTNHIISEFSGDSARGLCHVLAEGMFIRDGATPPFRIFGCYEDAYVRVEDTWLFSSRTLKLLVPSQGAAVTVGGISYDLTMPPVRASA